MKPPRAFTMACLMAFAISAANADDWPQYRGPDRTRLSRETGLLNSWPDGGPTLLRTFRDAGLGFSPPAIVGDRLYTMGSRGATDFLDAIDTATGRELWAAPLGPARSVDWGDGPCATPAVDGGRMYSLTTFGDRNLPPTTPPRLRLHYQSQPTPPQPPTRPFTPQWFANDCSPPT